MNRTIIQIHAPSEKSRWKESDSGAIGIVIRFIDQESGDDPVEVYGIDPVSDHNSNAWIWAAREAVRRLPWRDMEDEKIALAGMHPHIRRQFDGEGVLHGTWLKDWRRLCKDLKRRFPERWSYWHDPKLRRTVAFETALRLPETDRMMRQMGRFIDWPDSLPPVKGPERKSDREKAMDELFG